MVEQKKLEGMKPPLGEGVLIFDELKVAMMYVTLAKYFTTDWRCSENVTMKSHQAREIPGNIHHRIDHSSTVHHVQVFV